MSNADFKAAFAARMGRIAEQADTVATRTAEDMIGRITLKAPVGDPSSWARRAPPGYSGGTFRANWNLAFNAPDTSTRDTQANDAVDRARVKLAQYKTGQTIYITNSLPYAARIEFDSWSGQAPAGVVRVTVAEFPAVIRKAVGLVRQGAA